MSLEPLHSTKKTFYYNFFPTKEEEESLKSSRNYNMLGVAGDNGRVLVEIRDVYPPPVVDPASPWWINKTLTRYEIESGKIFLSWNDTFEHVLRYWSIGVANYIALRIRVSVAIWDVTQAIFPRKYETDDIYLQMVGNDEFVLVCMALMKDRNLRVYDEVSLYWDEKNSCFRFRLLM